jgi:hypothetical protein
MDPEGREACLKGFLGRPLFRDNLSLTLARSKVYWQFVKAIPGNPRMPWAI